MTNAQDQELIEITDFHKIWQEESKNFNSWLLDGGTLNMLSEVLGFKVFWRETESACGNHHLELVCSQNDGAPEKAIIEGQFGISDDAHLGKLISLASSEDAKVIIWIAQQIKEEHASAVFWFNSNTKGNVDVVLVKLKLWKLVGKSVIVPEFILQKKIELIPEAEKRESPDDTK